MTPTNNDLKFHIGGKKILFIGLKFYHFHDEIIKKIESYGAEVLFFPERNTSLLFGLVNRLYRKKLDWLQDRHFKSIQKKLKNVDFDYFFVIRGFKMPRWFVEWVKSSNPGVKTIMYQWDANSASPYLNLESGYDIVGLFNSVYSFDFRDVQENSDLLKYIPTFTVDEIQNLPSNTPQLYDFFYFGSYLPQRYQGMLKFQEYLAGTNHKLKIYFFMEWRYFWIERIKGEKLNSKLLHHKKMDRHQYFKWFSESKVIVDVSNPQQTGLALRVIDALAAGKRVITTNKWILNEPGIDPDQVCIVNMDSIHIPEDFFAEKEFNRPNYTIDKWLHRIFIGPDV